LFGQAIKLPARIRVRIRLLNHRRRGVGEGLDSNDVEVPGAGMKLRAAAVTKQG